MSVDYSRFFTALYSGRVEFILVGGTAANVHGSARLTQAVDIVYRRSRENVARLAAALAPFHPYLRGGSARSSIPLGRRYGFFLPRGREMLPYAARAANVLIGRGNLRKQHCGSIGSAPARATSPLLQDS